MRGLQLTTVCSTKHVGQQVAAGCFLFHDFVAVVKTHMDSNGLSFILKLYFI